MDHALSLVESVQALAPDKWNSQEILMMKRHLCPKPKKAADEITDLEFSYFLAICHKQNLDPLAQEIYPVKMGGKFTLIRGVDGYYRKAQESPSFKGWTTPEYTIRDQDGNLDVIKPKRYDPRNHELVAVTMNLIDASLQPEEITCHYDDYVRGFYDYDKKKFVPMSNWRDHPALQLIVACVKQLVRKYYGSPGVDSDHLLSESAINVSVTAASNPNLKRLTPEAKARSAQAATELNQQLPEPTEHMPPDTTGPDHCKLGPEALIPPDGVEPPEAKELRKQHTLSAADFFLGEVGPAIRKKYPSLDTSAHLGAIQNAIRDEFKLSNLHEVTPEHHEHILSFVDTPEFEAKLRDLGIM